MFVQALKHDITENANVEISVLRLDKIHPVTGGNKAFKLKYNLLAAKCEGKQVLLTFGGAYSNHIAATALAGKENGFKTMGIIRGEKSEPLNNTLRFAEECGMNFQFVSRDEYRKKETAGFLKDLAQNYPHAYIIPEGGNNVHGYKGAQEILSYVENNFDVICCAVGTGTTLAGIAAVLKPHQQALGIAVLKGEEMLRQNMKVLMDIDFKPETLNLTLSNEYTFGGYAKTNPLLQKFCDDFYVQTTIPIEPIYTGKMFYGIIDLVKRNYFRKGTNILCVHTGGLQYL